MSLTPSPISLKATLSVMRSNAEMWIHNPQGFVRSTYKQDPVGDQVLIDPCQGKILDAVAKYDKVAVRSSHGVGKTATAAWLSHWWLVTRWPALVVVTAGVWPQLEDRLLPEIRLWANNWRWEDAYEWQHREVHHKKFPDASRIIAASSDVPSNVEGFHSPNLLIIIDEAKTLPREVWAAFRGALTQKGCKVVVLSTPPLTSAGWYPELFGTKGEGWKLIHIPASASNRVSKEWIRDMERDFGKNSAMYQAKVLGDIPDEAAQVVISRSWVLAAQERPPVKDRKRAVVTCDVARSGENLTTVGLIHQSKHRVVYWEPQSTTMTVVTAIRKVVIASKAGFVCVDDTGVGGGVSDTLIYMQRQGEFPKDCTIIPVVFGKKSAYPHRFHTLKDELWWTVRNALKSARIALQNDFELEELRLPAGHDLKAQLLGAIYDEDLMNRIQVWDHRKPEDKKESRKALPTTSPDLAHTLVLGCKYYLTQADEAYNEPEKPMDAANREFWDRMRRAKHGTAEEAGEEYGYSERFRHFDGDEDGRSGGI